jgi:hypothetical protein
MTGQALDLRQFLELEVQIANLKNMAIVLEIVLDDLLEQKVDEKSSQRYTYLQLTEEQVCAISFSTSHIGEMAAQLFETFCAISKNQAEKERR